MKAIAAPLIAPPRSPDVAEPTELELELRLELLRLVRVIGAERGTAIRIVGEDATERTMAEEERRRAMANRVRDTDAGCQMPSRTAAIPAPRRATRRPVSVYRNAARRSHGVITASEIAPVVTSTAFHAARRIGSCLIAS